VLIQIGVAVVSSENELLPGFTEDGNHTELLEKVVEQLVLADLAVAEGCDELSV